MPLQLVAAGQDGHGKTTLLAALDLGPPAVGPPAVGPPAVGPPAVGPPGLAPAGLVAAGVADQPPVCGVEFESHDDLVAALLAAAPGELDGYVLVVGADAGITGQTREQVALLRALGLPPVLGVVTKTDLADPSSVLQGVRALIPEAPVHAVSVATGDGLGRLRQALGELTASTPARVDLPAALLAAADRPRPTRVIDAALDFGPHREREPDHGVRVIVHLRGRPSPARLARLGGRFWQVRLDEPLDARGGDRFVVRLAADVDGGMFPVGPERTLGGGVVLDPGARRHPTSNEVIVRLTRILRGQPPLPPEPPRAS